MKKVILPAVIFIIAALMISCAKSITTYEAAAGRQKCGRSLR
ncbi:MAG: hypothetical protein ABI760_10990 [Ferruginibacter sp.]